MKSCVLLQHFSRRRRSDRATEEVAAFIVEHREVYGVGPICEVLPIAPSTYYEFTKRAEYPETAPPRVRRDEALKPEIQRIWDENYQVYGARKVWHQMKREGFQVAKCTVERLMRSLGLEGVVRGRKNRCYPAPQLTRVGNGTDPPPRQAN
jgi:putative transposase